MRRVFVVVFALLLLGAIAGPAYAGTGGYVEVCKAPNAQLNGTFKFWIQDGTGASWSEGQYKFLAQGTCTEPIAVAPGSVKITEVGSSLGWDDNGAQVVSKEFLGTPTSTVVGKNDPPGANLASGWYREINVPAGGVADLVKVTFANTLVTGVIEVCKKVTDPSLTGSWSFRVLGGNEFDVTTSTAAGNCTEPITLPAGHFAVVEPGIQSITAITATKTALATNAATKVDIPNALIVATVDAGDASKQTIVTYTNNLVAFKLCKVWANGTPPVAAFPFTLSATGPAGPNTPPASVSVAPGTCKDLGSYRAGTRVTITEGIVPGTKVSDIKVGGVSAAGADKANRTVTVDLAAGETVVTYYDVPALNGWLKICKATTLDSPVVPLGTVFTFTLTAVTGYPAGTTATVTVAAGAPGTTQCSGPVASKFDAMWTVTEAARPNTVVTAITAIPTYVVVGGVNTNQMVLTAVNLVTRSANVTIGENNTTELTFTNKDPVIVDPVISVTPVVSAAGGAVAVAATKTEAATQTVVLAKKATASVAYARIVKATVGRYVVVRVNGTASQATLKLKLVNAKGKVLSTAIRTVKTNKQVPIKNLKVAKTVTGVKASLSA